MGKSRKMLRSDGAVLARDQFSRALRQRVGNGRPLGVDQVANAIGVCRRTLEGWLYGETTPRFHELTALIEFFDAGFANEILSGTGKVVADKAALDALPRAQEALQSLNSLATLLRGRP